MAPPETVPRSAEAEERTTPITTTLGHTAATTETVTTQRTSTGTQKNDPTTETT